MVSSKAVRSVVRTAKRSDLQMVAWMAELSAEKKALSTAERSVGAMVDLMALRKADRMVGTLVAQTAAMLVGT